MHDRPIADDQAYIELRGSITRSGYSVMVQRTPLRFGGSASNYIPACRPLNSRKWGNVNRMIRADEVANAVLFLACDESSRLQTTEIVIDGGTTGALAASPRYMRGEP
ncbi:SDR family oxidoreductase [Tabrizicola sp.]|jgi:NAD(P)-dependent dehydrogenase (short-subunit alcohol dehydrogenase family)|uniref:SDR family oxidoreductase n=1 Tax=Tabrizicola sp. TaxID=2005166 RepID=UPI003BAE8A39